MIRKIIYILLGVVICLAGLSVAVVYNSLQSDKIDPVENDLETIKNIAETFEDELADIGVDKEIVDDAITKIEEFNKETKYVVTFDIQNDTNPILSTTLNLPVDEDFFNSVKIGDIVAVEELQMIEEFVQLGEDFGSWSVTIKDKIVRE